MIRSFKHKGLEKLFYTNDRSYIKQQHAPKLARILDRFNASAQPQDMNSPNYKLHMLSSKGKGAWAVWITGNWRVTFQFDGPDAVAVDYRDYH